MQLHKSLSADIGNKKAVEIPFITHHLKSRLAYKINNFDEKFHLFLACARLFTVTFMTLESGITSQNELLR